MNQEIEYSMCFISDFGDVDEPTLIVKGPTITLLIIKLTGFGAFNQQENYLMQFFKCIGLRNDPFSCISFITVSHKRWKERKHYENGGILEKVNDNNVQYTIIDWNVRGVLKSLSVKVFSNRTNLFCQPSTMISDVHVETPLL